MFKLTEEGASNKRISMLLGRTEKSIKNRKYYLKKRDEKQSVSQPTNQLAANEVVDSIPSYHTNPVSAPSRRGRKLGSKNKNKAPMVQTNVIQETKKRSGVNAYKTAEEEFAVIKRMAKKYGATITIKIG